MSNAKIIDGKASAERHRERVGKVVKLLREREELVPGLAVVLVGQDPASEVYVSSKVRTTAALGMRSFEHRLPAETTQEDLLDVVRRLNEDDAVHGILVQFPLPKHLDEEEVVATIDPAKDVDGLHMHNAGLLASGRDGLVPCTPLGSLLLLREHLGSLDGLHALIIGRSNLVGKPLAHLLLGENCTVTVAHSRTRDLPAEARRADILVAAVGRPELVRGDWIKPGATVIDVGINRIDMPDGRTKLVGDVNFAEAVEVAGAITPVPGGVGPMTIAMLLSNTVEAACRQNNIDVPW